MRITTYGQLIRKIRAESGHSIIQASRRTGIPDRHIVEVEAGTMVPSNIFDVRFRRAYPQGEDRNIRLGRFFLEARYRPDERG